MEKLLSERRGRQDQSSEASMASEASIATKHTGGIHLKFMSLDEKTVGPIRAKRAGHTQASKASTAARRATSKASCEANGKCGSSRRESWATRPPSSTPPPIGLHPPSTRHPQSHTHHVRNKTNCILKRAYRSKSRKAGCISPTGAFACQHFKGRSEFTQQHT